MTYSPLTYAQILTRAKEEIDELTTSSTTGAKFSLAWWNHKITDAETILAQATGYNVTKQTVTPVMNTRTYALPTTLCWGIVQVEINGIPLDLYDPYSQDEVSPDWRSGDNGTPTRYVISTPNIEFDPKPDNGLGMAAITIKTAGTGYAVGDELTVGGRDGTVIVTSVSTGTVTGVVVGTGGSGYTAGDKTCTGGNADCVLTLAFTIDIYGGTLPEALGDTDSGTGTPSGLPGGFSHLLSHGAAMLASGADLYEQPQGARLTIAQKLFGDGLRELEAYLDGIGHDRQQPIVATMDWNDW
jgi:hypothetical protein